MNTTVVIFEQMQNFQQMDMVYDNYATKTNEKKLYKVPQKEVSQKLKREIKLRLIQ